MLGASSNKNFPETRPSLIRSLRDDSRAESAWREFFERYAPAVYRVARRQGLSHADADDIVQQSMLAVSTHIGKFEYDRDRGRFRQWIKTIAANKVRDLLRRGKAARDTVPLTEANEQADDQPSLDSLWEQEWKVQDMLFCLDQVAADISPRRFEAFRLYVLEGVSADETAEQLGMTRAHVYVTRAQVSKRIREMMTQLDRDGDAA